MPQHKAISGTTHHHIITSSHLHLSEHSQSQQWHCHIFVFVSIHKYTAMQKEW
jgi:hypothetical protein